MAGETQTFEFSVAADQARLRAWHGEQPTVEDAHAFINNVVVPATRVDPAVFRAYQRHFHVLSPLSGGRTWVSAGERQRQGKRALERPWLARPAPGGRCHASRRRPDNQRSCARATSTERKTCRPFVASPWSTPFALSKTPSVGPRAPTRSGGRRPMELADGRCLLATVAGPVHRQ